MPKTYIIPVSLKLKNTVRKVEKHLMNECVGKINNTMELCRLERDICVGKFARVPY